MAICSWNDKSISVEIPMEKPSYGEQYIKGAVPLILGVVIGVMAIVPIAYQITYRIVYQKDVSLVVSIFMGATGIGAAGCILLLYATYCWFIRAVLYEDRKRAKDREDFVSCQTKELKDIVVPRLVNLVLPVNGCTKKQVDSTGNKEGEK